MVDLDSRPQYGHDLEDFDEGLRRDFVGIGDTRRSLSPVKTGFSTDILPLDSVANVMGWTATMLLLGGELASALGCYVVGPVLGVFFSKIGAGFFAFLGFPLYELYTFLHEKPLNAVDLRFRMLSLSLSQGLLSGFALSDCHLSAQPPVCLAPTIVAFVFPAIRSLLGGERRNLSVSCGAAAFAASVVLGSAAGLLTSAYVFLSAAYAFWTAVVLQQMVDDGRRLENSLHLYHVLLFAGFLLIKAATFGIFGVSSDQLKFQSFSE